MTPRAAFLALTAAASARATGFIDQGCTTSQSQSGSSWALDGSRISAQCNDHICGEQAHTVLDLNMCLGNDQGKLVARKNGNYADSCRDCQVSNDGGSLICACDDVSKGIARVSQFDMKADNTIYNWYGHLACFGAHDDQTAPRDFSHCGAAAPAAGVKDPLSCDDCVSAPVGASGSQRGQVGKTAVKAGGRRAVVRPQWRTHAVVVDDSIQAPAVHQVQATQTQDDVFQTQQQPRGVASQSQVQAVQKQDVVQAQQESRGVVKQPQVQAQQDEVVQAQQESQGAVKSQVQAKQNDVVQTQQDNVVQSQQDNVAQAQQEPRSVVTQSQVQAAQKQNDVIQAPQEPRGFLSQSHVKAPTINGETQGSFHARRSSNTAQGKISADATQSDPAVQVQAAHAKVQNLRPDSIQAKDSHIMNPIEHAAHMQGLLASQQVHRSSTPGPVNAAASVYGQFPPPVTDQRQVEDVQDASFDHQQGAKAQQSTPKKSYEHVTSSQSQGADPVAIQRKTGSQGVQVMVPRVSHLGGGPVEGMGPAVQVVDSRQ